MSAPADIPAPRNLLCASGGALASLGAMVLLGRLAGWAPLVTVIPNGAPMAFSTAVAFFLSGVAFFAHGCGASRVGRSAAAIVATMAVFLGGVELSRVLLGVEKFLFDPRQLIVSGPSFGGWMTMNSALSFVLLAVALWLLGSPRPRMPWIVAIASVLLSISAVALLSYFTGLRWSVSWWRVTAMAVHTSAGFLVAAATLFAWVSRLTKTPPLATSRTLPFFAAAGTTVMVLSTVTFISNEHRRENVRYMTQTLQLAVGIDRFVGALARVEAATRNFSLTGEDAYLARAKAHRASAVTAVTTLEQLCADNPARLKHVAGLRAVLDRRFAAADAEIRARRERGVEAATQAMLATATDGAEEARTLVEALRADTNEQIAAMRASNLTSERVAHSVLLAGSLLTVALVMVAFRLVRRAQDDLRHANEVLEDRVRERTAALEASVAEVREREHRLRFLADSLPQLVWTARPDGSMENLNRGYLEYLGVTTEADGIARLSGVVHEDDLIDAGREWEAMFRERRSGGGELRLRRADGVYRWHLWRAHPECDSAGRIVRWVGTSTDIHDKKLSEERLEQRVEERTAELVTSEERFRQAFQFAGIGMAIVGLDGRWIRVNRSLCEIIGYTEPELLRKKFQDITHPDDLQADLAHVRELLDGRRRSYQMEKRYIHRTGRTVWIRLTASLVRDADNAPAHFVSQIEYITERKQLEASLAAARDQALEASRLKSEFLATMSHEIRTPMNGVIGMTSLLRDTSLTPVQAEYVRTIESSGEALLSIINDILDYSKIEVGKVELELVPFDLRECLQSALDLFAGNAAEKRIRLAVELAADVPVHVTGDVMRLRQILANLVGNAVKFTDRGEVVVSVAVETAPDAQRSAPPQLLHFTVRDTGIGIPPEGMPRLFKSFSQVDASTTRRFGGTGLGLAISKRLAELMGGTMWAESTPGQGSLFHFTAALAAAPTCAAPAFAMPAALMDGHGPLAEAHPLRLLIAEDNPVNLRVATLLLQRLGYKADAVVNGREALAAAGAGDYDVILMDIEMPELDGCEATRQIRALRGSATRPWIIALTAGATPGDRERAFSSGMNDYLTKPARAELISTALVRAHTALSAEVVSQPA